MVQCRHLPNIRCISFCHNLLLSPGLIRHRLFSSYSSTSKDNDGITTLRQSNSSSSSYKRVWKSRSHGTDDPSSGDTFWNKSISQMENETIQGILQRIGMQERQGGRMRQRQKGVLREDPKEDMRLLIENYTAPALASALRDREDTLQLCASLITEDRWEELKEILKPYGKEYVEMRRRQKYILDLTKGFDTENLEMLRRGLMRMPRRVSTAHRRRAGVVLPLCNVNGIPSILFEKRSQNLRAHPDEVCLPGGMTTNDSSIVSTCLREMAEEIHGLHENSTTVLGVLRCNWGEVHHLVGVAVTPVVCFIGELGNIDLRPNPDEVAECFTVPISSILVSEQWIQKEGYAPIYIGGPHIIWGLTGYILHRFLKDVLARYHTLC